MGLLDRPRVGRASELPAAIERLVLTVRLLTYWNSRRIAAEVRRREVWPLSHGQVDRLLARHGSHRPSYVRTPGPRYERATVNELWHIDLRAQAKRVTEVAHAMLAMGEPRDDAGAGRLGERPKGCHRFRGSSRPSASKYWVAMARRRATLRPSPVVPRTALVSKFWESAAFAGSQSRDARRVRPAARRATSTKGAGTSIIAVVMDSTARAGAPAVSATRTYSRSSTPRSRASKNDSPLSMRCRPASSPIAAQSPEICGVTTTTSASCPPAMASATASRRGFGTVPSPAAAGCGPSASLRSVPRRRASRRSA